MDGVNRREFLKGTAWMGAVALAKRGFKEIKSAGLLQTIGQEKEG